MVEPLYNVFPSGISVLYERAMTLQVCTKKLIFLRESIPVLHSNSLFSRACLISSAPLTRALCVSQKE